MNFRYHHIGNAIRVIKVRNAIRVIKVLLTGNCIHAVVMHIKLTLIVVDLKNDALKGMQLLGVLIRDAHFDSSHSAINFNLTTL